MSSSGAGGSRLAALELGVSGVVYGHLISCLRSRGTALPTFGAGMSPWREKLFATMHRDAASAADFLNLRPNRVVELGSEGQI